MHCGPPRSNTPLQSLALLNDPTYVEAARAFSELILRHSSQDSERLNYAFQRALSRDIQPAEREILQALLDKQREAYRKDPEAARQVLTNGAPPVCLRFGFRGTRILDRRSAKYSQLARGDHALLISTERVRETSTNNTDFRNRGSRYGDPIKGEP